MEFHVKRAGTEEVPEIMRIMEEAAGDREHPQWFAADDEMFVIEHLSTEGFIVAAETEAGDIAGFFLVKKPKAEENLGTFLGFTKEQLKKVMVMDSAVVDSRYRGNGLQGKMLEAAEKMIDRARYPYLMCTVHPDNVYSLENMKRHGYEVQTTAKCYGGLERYILLKTVPLKKVKIGH